MIKVQTVALLPLAFATMQATHAAQPGRYASAQLEAVEVEANIDIYRNRLEAVTPVLSYDLPYFQRFEPLTVGDMLKRIPGVSFSGDVLEYDAVQFRGAGPEYTQILINGKKMPGSGADRSIQVDRIPAELVERIEVIRSPNAAISAEGVAGTINIILKEGAWLQRASWRLATQSYDDGTLAPLGFASIAGSRGDMSYFLGVNVQRRYNPKRKTEFHSTPDGVLAYNELESDTRDGRDAGINGRLAWRLDDGAELAFRASLLRTDREEDEQVDTLAVDPAAVAELEESSVTVGQLLERSIQHENIRQQTASIGASYIAYFGTDTEMTLDLSHNRFTEDTQVTELGLKHADEEIGTDLPDADLDETQEVTEQLDIDDATTRFSADFVTRSGTHLLRYGILAQNKQRELSLLIHEREFEPGETPPAFEVSEDQVGDGRFKLKEQRLALYVDDTMTLSERASLELGLRATYNRHAGQNSGETNSDLQINPSAHFRYTLTASDRLHVSLSRTVRRAEFDDLIPYRDVNEDWVAIGNPGLDAETSVGLDLGWEHQLAGAAGILGANLFYRDISGKIESVQVGSATGSEGDEVPLVQATNLGGARIYGVEFDSSFPLTMLGLPSVGVFGNVSLLRSELTDPASGENRAFNNQPELVYNIGFNHDLDNGWAYGASYQKRSQSTEVLTDEVVDLRYDGNLEAFVEKRFGNGMIVRLAGNNLLDAVKREDIVNLDDGEISKREVQLETAGPVVILTLRGEF